MFVQRIREVRREVEKALRKNKSSDTEKGCYNYYLVFNRHLPYV